MIVEIVEAVYRYSKLGESETELYNLGAGI